MKGNAYILPKKSQFIENNENIPKQQAVYPSAIIFEKYSITVIVKRMKNFQFLYIFFFCYTKFDETQFF